MNSMISTSMKPEEDDSDFVQIGRAFFCLGEEDDTIIQNPTDIPDSLASRIIDSFYKHILNFDEAARQFRNDEHVATVKSAQAKLFEELVTSRIDSAYISKRRRVGRVHERAGISPLIYIGAYSFYLQELDRAVRETSDDEERAHDFVMAVFKRAFFDMGLALQTYVEAREETIQAREREIAELPTPVLQIKPGLLLVPVVGTLDSYRARALTIAMLEGIREYRARAVVLDITGVSAVDSAVANHLLQATTAARLMGAKAVLTGLSAEVATSLVKIGVTSNGFNTAGDLQSGIELAETLLTA